MKTLHSFAVTALLATLPGAMAAVGVEDRMTRTIPVQPGGRIVLQVDNGSIEVRTADTPNIELEVFRRVEAGSQEESARILAEYELTVEQTGNEVSVRGAYKEGGRREYGRYLRKHHYVVIAPREFNVDLTTSGGSISVGDLKGEVRGRTSGGSLQFGRVTGPIWGRTSGGSITLEGTEGNADVRTSGGSIRIGEVRGEVAAHTSGGSIRVGRVSGKVNAVTSGGSIEVKEAGGAVDASTSGGSVTAFLLAQPQAPCRLSTSGGNVHVHLKESVGVDLDASTGSGRVVTDFPVTVQGNLSKHALKAAINGGGPLLHLRTSGGSIHIRKAL
ncbi:MAG: DUF4097 family beta strand repeat-containing protein [Bryobacteraceae bacterium]